MTPEPIRQAVIPWAVFTDDVVAVAMDEYGEYWAHTAVPYIIRNEWQSDGDFEQIHYIKFDRGSDEIDWRNTLQLRPGYEVK